MKELKMTVFMPLISSAHLFIFITFSVHLLVSAHTRMEWLGWLKAVLKYLASVSDWHCAQFLWIQQTVVFTFALLCQNAYSNKSHSIDWLSCNQNILTFLLLQIKLVFFQEDTVINHWSGEHWCSVWVMFL